ncbi:MAG: hypothetical protein ACREQZ_04630 [Woeseiaceae bacterium]
MFIYLLAATLAAVVLSRRDDKARAGFLRAAEQIVILLPRMVLALIAAGFMVILIPTDLIGRYLGEEAGLTGILIGSVAGLLVPSGGLTAFALAAAFANKGAATPALIAFLTGWSVFALHRIFIFEIPLLGARFTRMRVVSVLLLPPLAGGLALLATEYLKRVAG